MNTLNPDAAPTCQPNLCAAYSFTDGVVGNPGVQGVEECTDGIRLATDTSNSDAVSCVVKCDNGYDSGDATIQCENDAWNNKAPVGDLTCSASVCSPPDAHTTGHLGRVVIGCSGMKTGQTTGCEVTCMQGYYISTYDDGAKSCTADSGNGASFKQVPNCPACPGGRYGHQAASASCVECPAGQYTDAAGGTVECTRCEMGRFETNAEATTCRPCPEGYYQEDVGQTACKKCGIGFHGPAAAATAASDCTFCLEGARPGNEGGAIWGRT